GPIATGDICCSWCQPSCLIDRSRGMGPCVRRDDEVNKKGRIIDPALRLSLYLTPTWISDPHGEEAPTGPRKARPDDKLRAVSNHEARVTTIAREITMSKSHGPLRVGVGGPVGSGKTALMDLLCKNMRERYDIAAITNDIYTKWDAEFLVRSGSLTPDRIAGVETGGCPHTAIREDASMNLAAVADMRAKFPD